VKQSSNIKVFAEFGSCFVFNPDLDLVNRELLLSIQYSIFATPPFQVSKELFPHSWDEKEGSLLFLSSLCIRCAFCLVNNTVSSTAYFSELL
jgi:hypothetical protein